MPFASSSKSKSNVRTASPLQAEAAKRVDRIYQSMGGHAMPDVRNRHALLGYNEAIDGPVPVDSLYHAALTGDNYRYPFTVGLPDKLASALSLADSIAQQEAAERAAMAASIDAKGAKPRKRG